MGVQTEPPRLFAGVLLKVRSLDRADEPRSTLFQERAATISATPGPVFRDSRNSASFETRFHISFEQDRWKPRRTVTSSSSVQGSTSSGFRATLVKILTKRVPQINKEPWAYQLRPTDVSRGMDLTVHSASFDP